MLIVVALLAVLAALAWPAMRKPLAKHRLWSAAKDLRAELVRTRLQAIRDGQPLQFRYAPGQRSYCVEPLTPESEYVSTPDPSASAWEGGFSNAVDDLAEDGGSVSLEAAEGDQSKLPKDIVFASDETADDEQTGPLLADRRLDLLSDPTLSDSAIGLTGEDWSTPIVFYPNGRTSDADILLVGERDYRIHLTLRGVTGTVSVGSVQVPSQQDSDDFSSPETQYTTDGPPAQDVRQARSSSPLVR
jgi:Tfp pilus assembly protein FimT